MKISVVIPTYKPQGYIWECLDSIKNQTFSKEDFEIILVLNGCDEPYKTEIIEYIEKNLSGYNVNFIQTDTPGVSNARNVALDCAKGDYIAFVDDDDFVSPSYLEELYDCASSGTIALCYPYAFKDGDMKQLAYAMTNQYEKSAGLGKHFFMKSKKLFSGPCMKLIPRAFIQDRKFDVNFKNGEDALFMFLISDQFSSVNFTSRQAVYYRRYRSDSAVTAHRSTRKKLCHSFRLLREYTKIYFKSPSKYNLAFYLTRILATMHAMVV